MSVILTCNAGSTNTKLAVFDLQTLECKQRSVSHDISQMLEWISAIGADGIAAIGHRVVHGGHSFTHPVSINDVVLQTMRSYIPLAPLHQPAAITLIEKVQRLYPQTPQIACFDTAFHHTIPAIERRLPLPRHYYSKNMQRYGFHGLSYQYIADVLPNYAGKAAHERVVVAHLGGGSSACAMKNLQSVATTMGFSTLDGLMMGTRCGALDPGVIFYLQEQEGMSTDALTNLLYYESGLLGVSGISGDMRILLASDKPQAQQAIELYCYLAAKQIASLLPAIQGLDVLVFTGGVGESAVTIRNRITELLRWAGNFQVYVVPTDEEHILAKACCQLAATRKYS